MLIVNMRKRFSTFLEFGQTPIEQVRIPGNSRDELPPTLAGLQWIYTQPELNELVFTLLEEKVIGDKQDTGRPGMDLWHILVLGVIRLTLNCDYDRLAHIANFDLLVRDIMGLPSFGIDTGRPAFTQKTIIDNVSFLDEELLAEINTLVAEYGLTVFKKTTNEKLEVKLDSYVLETNIHYPTDLNLMWDAARKCITILTSMFADFGIKGWRKQRYWQQQMKNLTRTCAKVAQGGGANKVDRVTEVAGQCLAAAYQLEEKVYQSIQQLKVCEFTRMVDLTKLDQVEKFHNYLIVHIDLVDRRLIKNESIPHDDKIFSLFEEHTELIVKGKLRPPVEFGHRLLLATEKNGLILDYKIMDLGSEGEEAIPLADRLLNRFGYDMMRSLSTDKGFSTVGNRELLELYIPLVVMPKKGRLSEGDKQRQSTRKWREQKHAHSAVESDINCLEHHGLDRCPDKGYHGYKRYVGLGVLAYNLHKIGAKLVADGFGSKIEKMPTLSQPGDRHNLKTGKAA